MSSLISVITVVRNDLAALQRTVTSIREQRHVNIQHIVIDGDSNDGTQAWLRSVNPPVDHWISEPDQGPYHAMNKGRALASGDWVQFLNAGDRYFDAESLSHLIQITRPDLHLVYGDVWRDALQPTPQKKGLEHNDLGGSLWPQKPVWNRGIFHNICHQAILYNALHLEDQPFDPHFAIGSDCDLLLRWSARFGEIRFAQTQQVVVRYRGQGLSQQHAMLALQERRISFRAHLRQPWLKTLNQLNLIRQILKLEYFNNRRGLNESKKICILSLRRRGGSVRYATAMIDGLDHSEHDIYVSEYCEENYPKHAILVTTYRDGLSFVISTIFYLPKFIFKILPKLVMKEYKIVYFPYVHYWNFLLVPLFKYFNIKIFCTIHDGIPHAGDGHWMDRFNAKICLRHSHHLIFLSEFVRDRLKREMGFTAQSSVIQHGILNVKLNHDENPPERPFPETFNLLFLGRVRAYKGLDLLLNALPHLDKNKFANLTIAGEISKELEYVLDSESSDRITWIKRWVSETEINELLMGAHILVLPYREATQSGIVTLGISSNIAMVCTRVGALPEQLRHDECIFTEADPLSLAEGINRLMNDRDLYGQLQQKLKDKANGSCWRQDAQQLKDLFLSV